MDFEKAKEFIEKSIDNYPAQVKDFYGTILKHVSNLENNEELEAFNIDFMRDIPRCFIKDLTEGPVTFERLQFFEGMSFMIYNWNDNVLNDADVSIHSISMKRFVDCFINIIKAKDISKTAYNNFYKFKQWYPPVNEVAIKYLDILFQENEKCIDTGEACSG